MELMRAMEPESVHCAVTSPPYWALRDYKVKGMIGLEETLDEYLAKMVEVFRAVRRVMRKDAALWLNLGDKMEDKQQLGIPSRVAFALQADGWWLRSAIVWHKPNPMPESVTDRPTKSYELVFLMTKAIRYFYDADAVREPLNTDPEKLRQRVLDSQKARIHDCSPDEVAKIDRYGATTEAYAPTGRNLRDVWTIPTEAFPGAYCTACTRYYNDGGKRLRTHDHGTDHPPKICKCGRHDAWVAHFATFPRELVARCLKAGTSAKGCCPECGTPWVRIVEKDRRPTRPGINNAIDDTGMANRDAGRHVTDVTTVGWSPSCECGKQNVQPCTVLDPFAGAGTVGVVARQMGLNHIGLELNPDYCEMARQRIADPEPEPITPDVAGQLRLFEDPAEILS